MTQTLPLDWLDELADFLAIPSVSADPGHYDVQPPAPLELWGSDPFRAEVRGEWLYACGVADDSDAIIRFLERDDEPVDALPRSSTSVCSSSRRST